MEVYSSSDDTNLADKTMEQKLWIRLICFVRAVRPALLYLLLPAGMVFFGMVFRGTKLSTAEFISSSGNFYYGIGVLGTFYFLYKAAKKKGSTIFREVSLKVGGVSCKRLILLYVIGLACGILLSVLLTIISNISPLLDGYRDMSMRTYNGKDFFLLLFTIGVSAPIVEEIIFRGYMYQRLQAGFIKKTAVIITSFIFAICHVSLLWIIYAFAASVVLCRLLEKDQNVLFPIAFHAGFNMSSILIYMLAYIAQGG